MAVAVAVAVAGFVYKCTFTTITPGAATNEHLSLVSAALCTGLTVLILAALRALQYTR